MNIHRVADKLLAILCVLFYAAHLLYHVSWHRPADSLWMCNISNLVLAVGLFFESPLLIRIAAVWLLPGIPLWLWDMMRTSDTHFTTFLTHIGGTMIGVLALRRIGYARQTWKYAALYAALVFLFSRLFTPAELNVNLSHTFYPGWEMVFHFYWQYLLFLTAQVLLGLYLLSILLEKISPPP